MMGALRQFRRTLCQWAWPDPEPLPDQVRRAFHRYNNEAVKLHAAARPRMRTEDAMNELLEKLEGRKNGEDAAV